MEMSASDTEGLGKNVTNIRSQQKRTGVAEALLCATGWARRFDILHFLPRVCKSREAGSPGKPDSPLHRSLR